MGMKLCQYRSLYDWNQTKYLISQIRPDPGLNRKSPQKGIE